MRKDSIQHLDTLAQYFASPTGMNRLRIWRLEAEQISVKRAQACC